MKIAIAIPSRDMVHAKFAFDLANLVGHFKGGQINIMHSVGTLICDQRVDLATMALSAGADYILWLDTDMRFPKDALDRLLAHGKDIVGCNYSTRMLPPQPTATNFKGSGFEPVVTLPENTGLEEVGYMGFGCVLTKADVFKRMEAPWFHLGYSTVNHKFIGEDVYFCRKAHDIGIPVLIDHDLSKEIKHIGCFEYRLEHTTIPADDGGA